ncbi:MAG: hypothetical protein QM769_02330 [Pseudoxanthomonas sp.]
MPLPETNPAAVLAFDALVNRALAKRVADTPYPRDAKADTVDESGASVPDQQNAADEARAA